VESKTRFPRSHSLDCGETISLLNSTPYTVAEVAALTGFSTDTIIRRFEREPGVLIITRPSTNRKRRYRSIRVPRGVYERVVRRITMWVRFRKECWRGIET